MKIAVFYEFLSINPPPVQRTPLQFFDRGSSGDGSNELIFLDFVPFNNQQDLAKPFFRFFFQIFEKFCLEDTWSPKILTRNSQKSKKNPIFPQKSYFFFLNLNSTCSQLSFEVHNVSVAQNLKIRNFWGQKLAGNSKIQILSYMHVIYLKRKLRSCRI